MMILQKISENNKLLILSLLVGLCSGAAAVVLEKAILFIQKGVAPLVASHSGFNWALLVLPAVGMLLALLTVRYVIKDNIGHGVTKVLKAISMGEAHIKPHNMWSSIATSAVTIGFGGSVGAEAPIVYTGAAIGSNLGRKFGLTIRSITILVGCGAAGAVAGIFKAPLAGVLFTLEILIFNISVTSMMPLLISTVSATVVSYIFLGNQTPFQCSISPFQMVNIPFYLILGVFCALVSLYFQRMTLYLEDVLVKFRNPFLKWAVCGLGLGVLVLLFPPLYGEGYGYVDLLLNGGSIQRLSGSPLAGMLTSAWALPVFFLLVLLFKVISMTLTNAGGGVGGTFGPTLFIGAIGGFVLVRFLNLILASTDISLPEQNFVLAGMAGAMAGVMQAPMTAIFLIAEITGGYELFLPLIITSTVSFGVTRIWEKYSIYTKRLAQAGELLTHDSDRSVITLMRTADLVRDKYPRLLPDVKLGDAVNVIADNSTAVIAVVDKEDVFMGYIDIGNVRKYLFDTEKYDLLRARDLMEEAPAYIFKDEKMETVMGKFDKTHAWRLPVVDENMKYLGFISRSRLLIAYREKLKEYSQD